MNDFEVLRHQVAIGGIVRNGIDVVPTLLVELLPDGEPQPRARSITREDGVFYFLDLPARKYQVRASVGTDTVSSFVEVAQDTNGRLQATWIELQMKRGKA